MPYDERPVELPLDIEECRTALWMSSGNVTKAAALLKVPSLRLRNFIKKSPYLTEESKEALDRLVDKAEVVIEEALEDADDPNRRDTMARFVASNLGRHRGYGTGTTGVTLNLPKGPMVISWGDGSSITTNDNSSSNTIEGSVNK
jgi:hypothetical protein